VVYRFVAVPFATTGTLRRNGATTLILPLRLSVPWQQKTMFRSMEPSGLCHPERL